MKPRTEKILLIGILLSGAIALFAKSAGAAVKGPLPGGAPVKALDYDPKLGKARRQTGSALTVWEFPVDLYEWGDSAAPDARLVMATGDDLSWVAFQPPPAGELLQANILAQGGGSKTQAILRHLLAPTGAATS